MTARQEPVSLVGRTVASWKQVLFASTGFCVFSFSSFSSSRRPPGQVWRLSLQSSLAARNRPTLRQDWVFPTFPGGSFVDSQLCSAEAAESAAQSHLLWLNPEKVLVLEERVCTAVEYNPVAEA